MSHIFDIALVFSPHEWVEAFHRHCTNTGILRIRSLVYDPTVLHDEDVDACIIADNHPALSTGLVQSLHDAGHIVIGICDDTVHAREFLSSVGVDAIFSSRENVEDLSRNVLAFLTDTSSANSGDEIDTEISLAAPRETLREQNAQRISVIGPGGTGATEFAAILTSRLIDSVIVDMDFEHPSIAPRLGLGIEPHVVSALEAAHNSPDDFIHHVQRAHSHGAIVGVTHSSFARDIRAYEIDSLLDSVAASYSHGVFDLGRVSEESRFFELQRNLYSTSDVIFIVGEPTPIGTLRILELTAAVYAQRAHQQTMPTICVVLNKCPKNREAIRDVIDELEAIEQITKVFALEFSGELFEKTWKTQVVQPRNWKKTMNEIVLYLEAQTHITRLSATSAIDTPMSLDEREQALA